MTMAKRPDASASPLPKADTAARYLPESGIRSKTAGSIQSYEFEFSVDNEDLARRLMLEGGKTVELHYKEYFGALPWRGFTKFIVDSIITKPSVQAVPSQPLPEVKGNEI